MLGEVKEYAAKYDTTGVYSVSFTRDDAGRIIQKIESTGTETHTYEYGYVDGGKDSGRLETVKKDGVLVSSYDYDANGNRTSYTAADGSVTSGSYDAQDRMTAYGSNSYEYTANGELLKKTAGSEVTSYTYDVLGNLKQVGLPDTKSIKYLVDGQNRRIGKEVNGVRVQGFLYEGSRVVAELDAGNAVIARFVYATRSNVPDYFTKGGVTYRIVSDYLGSPRLVVNSTTGEVVQSLSYDEYGRVLSDTNPGFQPFGYAGGLYDRDTGLVRFGARDYDAETGRWTAKDPIGLAAGTNTCAYVGNDPVNLIDPSGLAACIPSSVHTALDIAGLVPGIGEAADVLDVSSAVR